MEKPTRKRNRLTAYDYNTANAYFITICTKDKRAILWDTAVGATIGRPPRIALSKSGYLVEKAIQSISIHYPAVLVDTYVIMPNHIHLLLRINSDENGRPLVAPTVSTVIQQFKGFVTKQVGECIWQRSFYDHVIRNKDDYAETWRYIENNPLRWMQDELYVKDR